MKYIDIHKERVEALSSTFFRFWMCCETLREMLRGRKQDQIHADDLDYPESNWIRHYYFD